MSQKGYNSYRDLKVRTPDTRYEKMTCLDLTEESISDSQNFQLVISQGSSIEDFTKSTKASAARSNDDDDDDIIVLSDSSFTPSPKALRKSLKKERNPNDIMILDSSICDGSSSEDERFFQEWEATQKNVVQAKLKENNKTNGIRETSKWFTSDETSSNSSRDQRRLCSKSSTDSSITHISPTQQSTGKTNSIIKSFRKLGNKKFDDANTSSSHSTSTKASSEFSTPTRPIPQNTNQTSNSSKKLTKKQSHDILKTIRSARAVYESPRQLNKDRVVLDETVDEDLHPALSPSNKLKNMHVFIHETPPNDKLDVADASNVHEPCIVNHSNQPDVPEYTGLSARKKTQIAEWLLRNSPESRSDSSFSCVPPSNRSSLNSGNSSLERLEQNYETPNNRGRISKLTEKGKDIPTRHTSGKNAETNQINRAQEPANNDYTSGISSKKDTQINKVDQAVNENVDIFDKLREIAWKFRTNTVHPASEPRRNHDIRKGRGVQTERKNTNNQRKTWIADSDEDDSDSSLNDIRPQVNSKAKTVRKTKRKDSSFINDKSSSESGGDSLYYTALTNLRVPRKNVPKTTPRSVIVQRTIAICDPDTDEERPREDIRHPTDLGRRKLEYSDDEDDIKSSTSEFDPGDDVPPKTVSKKETKTPRPAPKAKFDDRILSSIKPTKSNQSFLESLSGAVPLSSAHPDAKKYRTNFKNTKDDLCKYLYKLYNERIFENKLPHDMPIEWNVRMRGTAGYCYNKKSVKALGGIVKSSRIVLATKILDTPDRLRDTLIHEMCHAAAWQINDVSDGHGPFWTAWANKAMKIFPELPPIRRCHDYHINTKFTYKCTSCGYSIGRHSKSLDVERKRCGHCYGKFELLVNKTTKSGTVQVQTPKREPSAFALFVKENYNSVKKERNVKHAEIMKILGQQFSAVKIAKKHDNDKENCPDLSK